MISTELHKTMAYQDSGDSDTPLLIMANKQVGPHTVDIYTHVYIHVYMSTYLPIGPADGSGRARGGD